MSNFVAGLTNDNPEITVPVYKQYRYVQYNGSLPAAATGSVSFPPTDDMFRYVIIQQQFDSNEAICFAEVKVFLRGCLSYHIKYDYCLLFLCSSGTDLLLIFISLLFLLFFLLGRRLQKSP